MRRRVLVRKIRDRWVWTCTLCHPATVGSTWEWTHTLRNVRRHLRNRESHHRHVADKIIT